MFALIRYYYLKEPYDLAADEIARLWIDLAWIRETQEEASKRNG